MGGDESESESSREDSDWDDSEGSDLSSQSASDFSSDEDDETKRSDGQKSGKNNLRARSVFNYT